MLVVGGPINQSNSDIVRQLRRDEIFEGIAAQDKQNRRRMTSPERLPHDIASLFILLLEWVTDRENWGAVVWLCSGSNRDAREDIRF